MAATRSRYYEEGVGVLQLLFPLLFARHWWVTACLQSRQNLLMCGHRNTTLASASSLPLLTAGSPAIAQCHLSSPRAIHRNKKKGGLRTFVFSILRVTLSAPHIRLL